MQEGLPASGPRRVLVTGGAGWTAAAILTELRADGWGVVVFDLPDVVRAGLSEPTVRRVAGDVAMFSDVLEAVEGVDGLVHLAVATGPEAYRGAELPFAVNVRGTYNVFEAARRRGVTRVVLVSEAAVHVPPGDRRLDARSDWRSDAGSDHLYDLTKRLQEEIARDFCETFGMAAVTLRAGHIVDGELGVDQMGRPLSEVEYARGGWVCRYDLAHACRLALAVPLRGYAAFHVVGSLEAAARFDIERTEQELGLTFGERFEGYPPRSPWSGALRA